MTDIMNIYLLIQRLPKAMLHLLTITLMILFTVTGHHHDAIATWEIHKEIEDSWPE
jgi:hypothetical protein